MRSAIKFLCCAAFAIAMIVARSYAQESAEVSLYRQRATGARIGSCLSHDCSVFKATIKSIGPRKNLDGSDNALTGVWGEDLRVSIDEWILPVKRNAVGEESHLLHILPPKLGRYEGTGAVTWDGVEIKPGSPLLVFRADPEWGVYTFGQRTDVIQVIGPNEDQVKVLREIVLPHNHLQDSLTEVAEAPRKQRATIDPMFAAYFLAYLEENVESRDKNITALARARLFGHPALSTGDAVQLAHQLAATYSRLSSDVRMEAVGAFVVAAASDDKNLALNGLMALVPTVAELPFRGYLTDTVRQKIQRNYQAVVRSGEFAPNVAIESQLQR